MILKTNGLISFSFSDSQEAKRIRGNENTFLENPDSRKYYVNMLLENSFSEELNMTLSAPFSYVKHLNFLNFEEFNQTNPIYINMVRHPVERVISWYYYARQNWYQFDYDPVKDETILKKSVMQPSRLGSAIKNLGLFSKSHGDLRIE